MACESCGSEERKGTIFHTGSERPDGHLCIDCFDRLRDLARKTSGCLFGDCPAEFYARRDPLNEVDRQLGHRPSIPLACASHRPKLGS